MKRGPVQNAMNAKSTHHVFLHKNLPLPCLRLMAKFCQSKRDELQSKSFSKLRFTVKNGMNCSQNPFQRLASHAIGTNRHSLCGLS